MTQKFVILGWQRTGSNMLVSALKSHPAICCHGELFRPNVHDFRDALSVVRRLDDKYHAEDYRHANPMQYLDAVRQNDDPTPFWGFKLLCKQNEQTWQALPRDPDWKSIILYRENLLAAFSSNTIARQARKASRATGAPVEKQPVEFRQKRFTRFMTERLTQLSELKASLDNAGIDYIETRYLEISNDEGLQKIVSFLGASPVERLTPRTKKRNTSKILERFSNPQEAERHLKQIGKESWAEEGQ